MNFALQKALKVKHETTGQIKKKKTKQALQNTTQFTVSE